MSAEDRPGDGYIQRDRNWHPRAFDPAYKSSVARSPQKALLLLPTTLSEETGPVFAHDMLGKLDNDLLHNYASQGQSAIGPRILVHGQVRDQSGRGVPNALVESTRQ